MNITKHDDHYLLKNEQGEYHFSIEEYEKLGKDQAIKFAEAEIKKKQDAFVDTEIDFKKARALGFCEYGIKDFCKQLELDIDKSYSVKELSDKLTKEVFLKYSDECLKIFGKRVFDLFGGVINFLRDQKNRSALKVVFNAKILSDNQMHSLACKFARHSLHNFEKEHPGDDRPREAIEAREAWVRRVVTDEQLLAAHSAARSALNSAAWSALNSAAYSAADSAAHSAAYSAAHSAAYSAADSAASSAASPAAWSMFIEMTIEELES